MDRSASNPIPELGYCFVVEKIEELALTWEKRIANMGKEADLEVAVGWTEEADPEVRLRAAINEFGERGASEGEGRPPARRALRRTIAGRRRVLAGPLRQCGRAVVHETIGVHDVSVYGEFEKLEEVARDELRNGIESGLSPDIAASTKRKRDRRNKGYTPLIDTGNMLEQADAVTRKVRPVRAGETP